MKQVNPHLISAVIGICSVGASFVGPTLYISDIKETSNTVNAVQDVRISNVEKSQIEVKQEVRDLNRKIDALLWKEGINPNNLE